MGRRIHMAQSVDADRFTDAYLRRHVLPCFTVDGRHLSPAEFRALCAEFRAKGMAVFPPCNNTTPDGRCAGHEAPAGPSQENEGE